MRRPSTFYEQKRAIGGHCCDNENEICQKKHSMFFKVKRNTLEALLPVRMSEGAAGYDISSIEDVTIEPGECVNVNTGLSFELGEGVYARTAGRSSLCLKHRVMVGADVIDGDYRGPITCLLINFGKLPFVISKGDRIAQIILVKIESPPVCEVECLSSTKRQDSRLGSTGKSDFDSKYHL